MAPALHILNEMIIYVASSVYYTHKKLPKMTSSPKQDQMHIYPY